MNKRLHISRRYFFIAIIYVFLLFQFSLVINNSQVSAWSGKYFLDDGCSSGHNVVYGGLPSSSYTSKEAFISYVENTDQSLVRNYFVRTMLGQSAASYWAGTNVSASELTDWEGRIRSTYISISIEGYSTADNTLRCGGTISGGGYNIKKYNPAVATTENSIVFRSNGVVVYVIKISCGNPLGSLPGIPEVRYNLTPTISLSQSGYVESGSSVGIKSTVTNSGPSISRDTGWSISRTVNGAGSSVIDSYTTQFPVGAYSWDRTDSDTDFEAGTKLCYTLSIHPNSNNGDNWAYSNEACVTVGKKPKVQIQGGDLWSSGTVNTSTSVKSNTTFGSWVEYGIFAAKSVSGMASGAAFSGSGLSSASVTKYSKLSFNNTDNSDCKTTSIGCYSTTRSLPDVAANFSTSDSSQVFSGGSLNDKQGIYRVTENNISIDASDIQKGQWVVINAPDATVTITGDIKYTSDTLTNINDIPQVIIIAKNIIINNSVTNVDSWLIAKNDDKTGSIKTCEEVGNVVSKCNNKLTVNGPVITDQLYLYRTAGSGAGGESGSSAETFNLRPDAYLWSYSQASKSSRVQTIYTTELPPRL